MNEDTIQDFKQFITTTVSQQTTTLREEVAGQLGALNMKLSGKIDDLDEKLTTRIDDLSASVAEVMIVTKPLIPS